MLRVKRSAKYPTEHLLILKAPPQEGLLIESRCLKNGATSVRLHPILGSIVIDDEKVGEVIW